MRKCSFGIISLSFCLLLTACTGGMSNDDNPNSLTSSNPIQENIVDSRNHIISINQPINRIVTTDSLSTDICLALGLKDTLVAIESVGDDECFYKMIDSKLCKLPRISLKAGIDIDKIESLNSQLVLLPSYMLDQVQYLEEKKINTYVYDVRTFDDLSTVINHIAALTDKKDQAQSLLTYYSMQKERIRKFEKTNSTVYFPSPDHYMYSNTKDMFISKVIVEAGGVPVNVTSETNDYQKLSDEQLVELNPDYIMIPADAAYSKMDLVNNPSLQNINAIKNNKVFKMPDQFEKWQEPVPSSILGMMWISSILHSDQYPFEDLQKEVILFYQTFYGFTPNKSDITF